MKIRLCFTFLLGTMAFSVLGCSCMMEVMSVKKILSYDMVFDGSVIEKETVKEIPKKEGPDIPYQMQIDYYKYTFKIKKKLKGEYKGDLITIYSPTQGATCGVNYDVGDRLYIYSYVNNKTFYTGLCSNNMRRKKANRSYKKILRAYKKARATKEWTDIEGNRIGEGKVMNNMAQGNWKFFHQDGSVESEGAFLNGKKHGTWKYYRNTKRSAALFKNLNKNEQNKILNKEHILYRSEEYDIGEILKREKYF